MSVGGQRRRARWLWIAAAAILVVVLGAIVLGFALRTTPSPTDTTSTGSPDEASPASPATSGTTAPEGDDALVTERGWVREPATDNPEEYASAALIAAGSFDTTLSGRDEWVEYLETWFTPDTRYTSPDDRADSLDAAKLELRQSVLLPESEWESLADESGRVMASLDGTPTEQPVEGTTDQSIWTGDITLIYARSAPSGEETSYEERARVSVQVLCGPDSVPAPGTGQSAGDCKVVRFFSEPIEG